MKRRENGYELWIPDSVDELREGDECLVGETWWPVGKWGVAWYAAMWRFENVGDYAKRVWASTLIPARCTFRRKVEPMRWEGSMRLTRPCTCPTCSKGGGVVVLEDISLDAGDWLGKRVKVTVEEIP